MSECLPRAANGADASVIDDAKRLHLVGIGGVSMCALAEALAAGGHTVTGSDISGGRGVERLRAGGISVTVGHGAALIAEAAPGAVIRSAAIDDLNPEIMAAREAGIPVISRAQAWGRLMRRYERVLCVAGTHGKTTTTGMAAHIALEAGLDPSVMLGGELPPIDAGHRIGGGNLMVFEACEYRDSFLSFMPTVAVILNIELDHLDYFRDLDHILDSFARFAALTPGGGAVVANGGDRNVAECLRRIPPNVKDRRVIRFGTRPDCDVRLVAAPDMGAPIEIYAGGRLYAAAALKAPGAHNAMNAAAAAAAAYALGIPGAAVSRGLESFTGARRRFERLGHYNGAEVVDDYAHHPTEVAVTIETARGMGYKRVLCAFQPHTYTRTAALFDDFAAALAAADKLYVAEIYAARERPTGLSAAKLAGAVPRAEFFAGLDELRDALARDAMPGDLILTMGAGDIERVGRELAAAGD
ncbi:MAG: UDP-N-acetylmuramate--L-alanine ligase [Oscillospiraceae bacterium]|nr:UDP-N-acetylmuramate--L-alanine ligase [Oscillospiraceae bacterium]